MMEARYYARAGGDPVLIAAVANELEAQWDPNREFAAPDGEHRATSHAAAILGMLAADGSPNGVKGYLRRAEEAALGAARTTSPERGALAEQIWRMLLDHAIASARSHDDRAT